MRAAQATRPSDGRHLPAAGTLRDAHAGRREGRDHRGKRGFVSLPLWAAWTASPRPRDAPNLKQRDTWRHRSRARDHGHRGHRGPLPSRGDARAPTPQAHGRGWLPLPTHPTGWQPPRRLPPHAQHPRHSPTATPGHERPRHPQREVGVCPTHIPRAATCPRASGGRAYGSGTHRVGNAAP